MRIYFKDKSNACALNFDVSNARGRQDQVRWTQHQIQASALDLSYSREKVNANLLT